ncbi:hypothetical protein BX600DRAFT_535903 [Xylariales sp. PMI_506]|nr:hypothetical protein BX600DRAFT_535903 [Xylariales sp. PMI_506]
MVQIPIPDLEEIHVCCLRGDIEGLENLLKPPNQIIVHDVTEKNETPLMLASLMGHTAAVVLLLGKGAKRNTKDIWGNQALFYATDAPFAVIRRKFYERHGFAQKKGAGYDRQAIISILHDPLPLVSQTPRPHAPVIFRKVSTGIEAYQRLSVVRTPPGKDTRTKTCGFIRTQDNITPLKWATSGFSKVEPPDAMLLEWNQWVKNAMRRLAPLLDFKFKASALDHGFGTLPTGPVHVGRFFGCHVEIRLAVWYCFTCLAAIKSWPTASATFLARHLKDLSHLPLEEQQRSTVIEIDQKPCGSCKRFLRLLSKLTRIEFTISCRRRSILFPEDENKHLAMGEIETEQEDLDNGSETDGDWSAFDEEEGLDVTREESQGFKNIFDGILEGDPEHDTGIDLAHDSPPGSLCNTLPITPTSSQKTFPKQPGPDPIATQGSPVSTTEEVLVLRSREPWSPSHHYVKKKIQTVQRYNTRSGTLNSPVFVGERDSSGDSISPVTNSIDQRQYDEDFSVHSPLTSPVLDQDHHYNAIGVRSPRHYLRSFSYTQPQEDERRR